jgi:regulator of extracellular matrix RemA (YlzA/DUF370 family)
MEVELIQVGFNNFIATNRVVAIAIPKSSSIKRTIQAGRDKGLLIDLTNGKRVRSVIFTDSEHIFLAALAPETITGRILKL